jgi:hypothetical protein
MGFLSIGLTTTKTISGSLVLSMIKKKIYEIDSATQLISVLDVYTACNKKNPSGWLSANR